MIDPREVSLEWVDTPEGEMTADEARRRGFVQIRAGQKANPVSRWACVWGGSALLIVGALGGGGLFCLQVFAFLKSGEWLSVSVRDVVVAFGLIQPADWLGLQKLLNLLPLALCLFLGGFLGGANLIGRAESYRFKPAYWRPNWN